MAPTIESDENDLILKVITDAEQNLNCDFSLKTEQKSAFHAICKRTNNVYNQTLYYRSIDTIVFSKVHLKFIHTASSYAVPGLSNLSDARYLSSILNNCNWRSRHFVVVQF